jgi:hypothetical protein
VSATLSIRLKALTAPSTVLGTTLTYSSTGASDFTATVSGTVSKFTPTVTATGATSFVYSGSPQGPGTSTVTGVSGGIAPSGLVTYSYAGTGGTTYSASATKPTNVGTYSVTASAATDANYAAASSSPLAFSITQTTQTITFNTLNGKTFGDADFGVSATASSGLTVSFSSQTAGVCTVTGTTVHIVTAGTCTVRASQAGDTNYSAATNVDQSFSIGQAGQTITFNALGNKIFGDADFGVSATASSGLTVSFSSQTAGVCTVTGATVHIVTAGTCTVRASQAGDTNYSATTNVDQSFSVSQATPVITFGAAPTPTYLGGNFTVSATTTNGDSSTLTYSVVSGPCALVSGATFSSSGAGTCVVKADGAATTNYNSATASQNVTIAKAEQSTLVAMATPSTVVFGSTSTLSSTGGSGGGGVTFSSGGSNGCSVSGTTLSVTNASGTCAVTATKAADTDYNAATSAPLTVTLQKADQATLTVNDPGTVVFGSTPQLTTSGGSGTGALTFSHGGSTGCTVTSGGILTVISVGGSCDITASKAADTNYNPTTSAPRSITLAKGDQDAMIAVATPSTVAYGSTSTLSSTGGSGGGAVTFSAGLSNGCSITGTTLSVTNASGTCAVTATKAADTNYNAATSAPLTVTLTKAAAVITFGTAPPAAFPGADFTVSASTTNTDNSGVSYIRVSGPCAPVHGGVFTPTGVGTCQIEADGAATDNFEAAFNTQNVTITSATFTLTVTNGGHGTVTSDHSSSINCGSDCTEDYNAATPVSLTATPDAGYRFDGWTGDCSGTSACNLSMDGARNVGATFVLNDVALNGSGSLPAGTYHDITIDAHSGVITACGDIFVTGTFTLTRGVVTGCGAGTSGPTPTYRILSGGPSSSFVLGDLGILHIQSPDGIAAAPALTGQVQTVSRSFSSLAGYVYDGGVNQTVGDGLPATVGSLTISNAGSDSPADNTVTGNGGQIVTGLLSVADGVYESHSDYADVTIEAAGTLTLTGPTTVSGNWTNNGGTLSGNFPVTLDGGTGQTITGNTTFYSLVKSVTAAQALNFASGSTTTVSNSLTLNGTAGNLLSLRSTTDGTPWTLNATGTRAVGYVDVKDSDATGSITAINASNSVDSGGNTNWTFNTVTNYTITVTQTANGTISPGTTTVTSGSNTTFHIVPNTGYDIATLVVDGVSIPVQSPYTFTNVTANHTLTATYAVAACRTISMPTLTSTTGIPVIIPVNTTDVTGGNVISAQFKVTYDPSVITPIAGTDADVVTAGPVLPAGTTIDINRAAPGIISFSINGSTPFSGTGALVDLHMNVIGAPTTSTPLALTAIDPAFPTIFYNGGTVCASATSGSLSVITNTSTTTVTSSLNPSVYGDSVTFTATVSPASTGGTVQFMIDGNPAGAPVPVVSGIATYTTSALTVAGSPHSVTGDYSGFGTYGTSSGTLLGGQTVTPKTVTITAGDKTRQYGAADPAFTFTTAGLVNGDTLTTNPTCTSTATVTSGVGTYPITCSGATASSNYTISYVAGTLTITTATITITAQDKTRQYGAADPAFTFTTAGLVNGDTLTTNPTCTSTATVTSGVGTYPITCSGATASSNYTISYVAGTLTITTATITITAQDKTRQYGAADPAFTFTTAGLVNGDTLTTNPTCTSTATVTSGVGTYPITCSGAVASSNYTISYVDGTLTITTATITITAQDKTRQYGAADPAFTFTTAGLVNGDTLTTNPTCTSTATVTSGVGTYPITCSGAVASSNYTISYVAGTLTITTATITITAQDKTRQYGAADPAFTFTTAGLVNGDSLITNPTCTSAATVTSGAGTYPITCSGATASSNYTISYVAGTLTITTATITITAQNKTRQYGAADPAFTFTTAGLVNGDSLTTNPTCTSTATVTSSVGTYPITCSGAAASSNYTISYVAGTLTITVRPATWTTNPASKSFGDSDPVPLTTGSSDFLVADGVTATYARAPGEAPGTYHITATLAATGDLNNYSITNTGAEFTINARTLTGQVTYENAASPVVVVPHTTITATGPAPLPLAVQNDLLTGNYSISGFGAGSYTITPSKAPYAVNINNGIFANDASLISQHVVHLITLNPVQQRAAQVGGQGTVTAFDASLIAQYIVGIPNPLNTTGNWNFTPASPSLTVLPNSVQNFSGILMGDVSGDWAAETFRPAAANRFTSVRALLTDATATPGSNVAIPLRIENMGGAGITAYQFDVEYDPAVITPAAVAASVSGTIGQGLSVVSNAPTPGLLKVVVYGALPVSGEGVYVNLQFSTIGGMGSTTPLNIGQFRLNDGTAPVYTINGSVTVGRSDDNALRGRVMTPTGAGLANARVIATSSTGERFAVLAGSLGYFEFGGLTVNETYTISVESKRYSFTPRTVSLTANLAGIDMIADQ